MLNFLFPETLHFIHALPSFLKTSGFVELSILTGRQAALLNYGSDYAASVWSL